MKKKILAVLVAIFAIMPVAVNAFEVGDYVNFFKNDSDKSAYNGKDYSVGIASLYIGENNITNTDGTFLEVLNMGFIGSGTMCTATNVCEASEYKNIGTRETDGAYTYTIIKSRDYFVSTEKATVFEGTNVKLDVATMAKLKKALKLAADATTIDVSSDELATWLNNLTGGYKQGKGADSYIVTSDVEGTTGFKAIKVTKDAEGTVTAAAFATIAGSTAGLFPATILYMNEDYTCSGVTTGACYSCPKESNAKEKEYRWIKDSTIPDGCTLVEGKTEATCAGNSPTGVESYLIPAAVVLGVCAIVLTVVKRKDAFRAI